MGLLEGEFERGRHNQDGESAELCGMGHQKQEGREKHLKRQEKYKMPKEIDAAKEGKGCTWESSQMTAVQGAQLVLLRPARTQIYSAVHPMQPGAGSHTTWKLCHSCCQNSNIARFGINFCCLGGLFCLEICFS